MRQHSPLFVRGLSISTAVCVPVHLTGIAGIPYGRSPIMTRSSLGLLACLIGCVLAGADQPASPPTCEYRLASTGTLDIADSGDFYIEPSAMGVAPRGSVLVGGLPNLITRRETRAGNSLFGVVIGAEGRRVLVPRPAVKGSLQNLRAAPTASGWLFSFGQSDTVLADRHAYERLLVGEYNERSASWGSIDTLTPPAGFQFGVYVSAPVVKGDLQAVAVEARSPSREPGVLVFSRREQKSWVSDFIPMPSTYLGLETLSDNRLILAAVGADMSQRSDANSILLVNGPSPWRRIGFVPKDPAAPGEAHALRVAARSDTLFLGFIDNRPNGISARIAFGPTSGPFTTAILDSSAVTITPVLGAAHLWITQSQTASQEVLYKLWSFENGQAKLLFHQITDQSAWLAAAVEHGGVTIVQPVMQVKNRSMSTRIIRLAPACTARGPRA
jgi:hypothetical protein